MTTPYLQHIRTDQRADQTPQSEPIPGSAQVANSAGGYAWGLDDWQRLDRFLILGSEGGTYYATERRLTVENAAALQRALVADGPRVVARIVEISEAGRAPKNEPSVLALAIAASRGDAPTRRAACAALPAVCRTGTHLLHFVGYVKHLRGWGQGIKRAVAAWYQRDAREVAHQVLKYRQRDAWSQRDVLRLAHPTPPSGSHNAIYHWVTRGWPGVGSDPHPDASLVQIWAAEKAVAATDAGEVARLVREYRLPREAVPTNWLSDPKVWEALLDDMPTTALIRNLATLTRIGLVAHRSEAARLVERRLANTEALRLARIHPVALLGALQVYSQGRGQRSSATWTPVQSIVHALDAAFYAAFGTVEPTGRRTMLALDVSGSMAGGRIAGVPGLTPRVGSVAMAMVTADREPSRELVAFSHELVPFEFDGRARLDDALRQVDAIPMGGTDCAAPIMYALDSRRQIDTFVVYTDSETWYGPIHPAQALARYRAEMGIAARLVVVGMVANEFTLADPEDSGMLDVVGFDSATPDLIGQFSLGAL
ncbi:MAG: TROVE domain-containing protein [Chloroflexota bacterium]